MTAALLTAVGGAMLMANSAAADPEVRIGTVRIDAEKVDICHRSASETNPYETNQVDRSSIALSPTDNRYLSGHGDHTGPVFPNKGPDGKWGDIIPPFDYVDGTVTYSYGGYNWTSDGQAIYENGCEAPEPPPPPTPSIALDKVTGAPEVTASDGIDVTVGAAITWTYTITNGPVAVTGLTLTDTPEGTITCPKTALDALEVMVCTATGTAGAVDYDNSATVSATATGDVSVTATDTSSYDILRVPSIGLVKVTGASGITPADGIDVAAGTAITWTYTITNGLFPVSGLTLTDTPEGAITCPKTALDALEVMVCTATGTAGTVDYDNSATVSASARGETTVTATDTSSYDVLPPTPTPTPTPTPGPGPGPEPAPAPAVVVTPAPATVVEEPVVVAPLPATVEETPEPVVIAPQPATIITPQAATAGGGSSEPTTPTAAWILLLTGTVGLLGAGTRMVFNR